MKYLIAIVLYKHDFIDSTTYLSLKNIFSTNADLAKKYKLVFWDNSPSEFNRLFVADIKANNNLDIDYIPSSENKPLSHVYNEIINIYNSSAYQYLIIFDQDSVIDVNYFKEFESVIDNKLYDVILPVVKFKDKIVSPTKIYFMKGFYYDIAPYGEINIKTLSAINSGMILSFEFIKSNKFQYNKDLKNYCTDDNIMMFLRSKNGRAYILKYELAHDLSFCTLNDNSDSLRERYNEMVSARKILYSRNLFEAMFTTSYFLLHRVYMAFKYKDPKYLKG